MIGVGCTITATAARLRPPVSIWGTPAAATVGAAFSFTPTTANGWGTKSFAYVGTDLASHGMTFDPTTGAISADSVTGSAGTISGTITVTDDTGSAPLAISITVLGGGASLDFSDPSNSQFVPTL